MISKQNRLTEREVKKVLRLRKPFFAYGIVLNYSKNNLGINRFAIVIGGKSVNTNVTRVFFRRKFYNTISSSSLFMQSSSGNVKKTTGTDFVFVVKKQTQLNRSEKEACHNFEKDLNFLIKKVT